MRDSDIEECVRLDTSDAAIEYSFVADWSELSDTLRMKVFLTASDKLIVKTFSEITSNHSNYPIRSSFYIYDRNSDVDSICTVGYKIKVYISKKHLEPKILSPPTINSFSSCGFESVTSNSIEGVLDFPRPEYEAEMAFSSLFAIDYSQDKILSVRRVRKTDYEFSFDGLENGGIYKSSSSIYPISSSGVNLLEED